MSASVAVILLNYKRPQNIGRIVAAARQGLPDAPVFVLDQAYEPGLAARRDVDWRGVWLQRPGGNRGAGARIPLAANLPFEHLLAIDDDTLLTAEQISALAARLAEEPDRAHGVWGERLEMSEGAIGFRTALSRIDAPLSVLNQVYAFHRRQAEAAIALARRVGFATWDEVRLGDDILLSAAAAKPPMCHDLGPIEMCPTCDEPGVAVWKSQGFREHRHELARRLIALRAIAVFSPLTYAPA